MLIAEFFGLRVFTKILGIRKSYLFPPIPVLCIVEAFASTNRMFNVYEMLICGCIAVILTRTGFPITPIIISYILGTLTEEKLRRGLMFTNGNIFGFFKSPIAAVFLSLALLSLAVSLMRPLLQRRNL